MIIDTHFHAFPRKFLELMPEAQRDVRGVGFHAFHHQEYLDTMDKYGIDVGVLSNTGGRIEKCGGRDDQFYPMTLQAMEELDVAKEDKEKIYYKNAQELGF